MDHPQVSGTPVRLPTLRRPLGWRDLDAATVQERAIAAFLLRYQSLPSAERRSAAASLPASAPAAAAQAPEPVPSVQESEPPSPDLPAKPRQRGLPSWMLAGAIALALSQVILLLVAVRAPKGAAAAASASESDQAGTQGLQRAGPDAGAPSPLSTVLPYLGVRPSATAESPTRPEDEQAPRLPAGARP
jgi:hypothetical protein